MNERVELDPRPEGCYWGLANLRVPDLSLSLLSGVYRFRVCIWELVCRTQDEFQAEPLRASPTRQLLQLEEVRADLFEHALHHGMRIRGCRVR